MDTEKANFFHQVTERIVKKHTNILLNMDFPDTQDNSFKLNDILLPILNKCEDVYIVDYKKDWLNNVDKAECKVSWPFELSASFQYVDEKYAKLSKDFIFDDAFKSFWLDPSFYYKDKIKGIREVLFPGVIVLEFHVSTVPVLDLSSYITYLGCVNNPYSGKVARCKRWIKKENSDNKVFIAYKGPSSFMFLGTPHALTSLLDRFMTEAKLKHNYQELCPSIWLDEFNESDGIDALLKKILEG